MLSDLSVTFTAGGGGLMALVIVQPLLTAYMTQECRRDTSGGVSYGACNQFASIINNRPQQIKDGAVLDIFAAGHAGSLASSILAGILETTWN